MCHKTCHINIYELKITTTPIKKYFHFITLTEPVKYLFPMKSNKAVNVLEFSSLNFFQFRKGEAHRSIPHPSGSDPPPKWLRSIYRSIFFSSGGGPRLVFAKCGIGTWECVRLRQHPYSVFIMSGYVSRYRPRSKSSAISTIFIARFFLSPGTLNLRVTHGAPFAVK